MPVTINNNYVENCLKFIFIKTCFFFFYKIIFLFRAIFKFCIAKQLYCCELSFVIIFVAANDVISRQNVLCFNDLFRHFQFVTEVDKVVRLK